MGLLFNRPYKEGKVKYWQFFIQKKSEGAWYYIKSIFSSHFDKENNFYLFIFLFWEIQIYKLDLSNFSIGERKNNFTCQRPFNPCYKPQHKEIK